MCRGLTDSPFGVCALALSLISNPEVVFLHTARHSDGSCVLTAQPVEEVPARWTEGIFLNGRAAPPARVMPYFGRPSLNAVFFDGIHTLLTTGRRSLSQLCSPLCSKSFGARTALRT